MWTPVTVAASWGVGHVLGAIVASRAPRWMGRHQALGESVGRLLRRRLPWWAALVGLWLAAGYWPLTPEGRIMTQVQGGVPEFAPFIRYHTFADSSINFTVILRGKEYVDQHLIRHEFIKRLHARFDREGITIPFPIRTLARRATERERGSQDETGQR